MIGRPRVDSNRLLQQTRDLSAMSHIIVLGTCCHGILKAIRLFNSTLVLIMGFYNTQQECDPPLPLPGH